MITYPLTLPSAPGFLDIEWDPVTLVGMNVSPWTGQTQTYVWPGQWWRVRFALPPMKEPNAGIWEAWRLSLNGYQGTFSLGDPLRKTSLGNPSGVIQVGASAAFNSTVLPLQGGAGTFAIGDWLQVSTHLYRVLKVNAGSVDVFPRLRASYAQTTTVVYSNAVGLFRLDSNGMSWSANPARFHSVSQVSAVEAL